MAMTFTPDQQKVIDIRDCNVLVSAAAGSGKTAVLVERILGLISDSEHPVDIDRLLVVTFTNAAAAEMRERIHNAILARLESEPDNDNLQRQAVLVHHARITTIDSFCRFILKNHFQEIDLDPGFTIGDPGKIKLMEKEAIAKVMEEAYAGARWYEGFYDDFIDMTDVYATKGQDRAVEDMVMRLYRFVMSLPFPEKWLMHTLEDYQFKTMEEFLNSSYIRSIVTLVSNKLERMIVQYNALLQVASEAGGPDKYVPLLEREREMVLEAINGADYAQLKDAVCSITFDRLPTIRKDESCDEDKKEAVKQGRERIKKRVAALKENYFFESLSDMKEDMLIAGKVLKPLVYLTLALMKQFAADKAKENVIDFSDMEHFALKILVDEDGNPTDTARLYQEHYAQVMIDEYQDSNEVQELLLTVVSKDGWDKPNRFMVGDMKQSIYKFRMARPELFLEKYHRYQLAGGRETRIDLKQNFRSRKEVIDAVNNVFYPLMDEAVGGIRYDEDAALYVGATYPEALQREDGQSTAQTEMLIYEYKDENGEASHLSKTEGEAAMIASRIKELMQNGQVTEKATGNLRPVTYSDIVILVRSTTGLMEQIQETFKKEGIPVSVPSRTGYFSATEVQTLLKLLSVLENPGNDIPLATVLKSPMYGFTDEELAEISLISLEEEEKGSLYRKLCLCESDKAKQFLAELKDYRKAMKTETVHDLLYQIIRKHRYLDYVTALPGGTVRRANVEMLLEKAVEYEMLQMHGVFGFLQYMKQLEKYEVDYGEGSGDSVNCVTLMTIHKSKGLEFPICFVAGLSKRFNKRDLSGSMLLHTDLGVGMEYRNPDTRVRRKTIKQIMVAEQLKNEEMGEELRVLYVALTRAKEKLILTGAVDRMDKAVAECSSLYGGDKVDPELILDSNQYLKLLLHAYSLYQKTPEKIPQIILYHEDDFTLEQAEQQFDRRLAKEELCYRLGQDTDESEQEFKAKIQFAYPHPELQGLYTKTSVSELKMAALHEDEQTDVMFETQKEQSVVPLFMQEEQKVSGTTRGTAYHRLMELLIFKDFADVTDASENESAGKRQEILEHQVEAILQSGKMSQTDMDLIDMDKVKVFLQSNLAAEMAEADAKGKLYKEQPFVMAIEANRVNSDFPQDESMLIQGIIDAYYEKDGKIYLLDYKTDRVDKKEDLIQRYQTQLDYYKEALEQLTGKEVGGIYIYSYHFLESITIRL